MRTLKPEAVALGQRIRVRRQRKGLTGEDMRRLAGVHPTCLSFIELGKREPSLSQLRRIAAALGTSEHALLPRRPADS